MGASRKARVTGLLFCIAGAVAIVPLSTSAASISSADTHWTPTSITVVTNAGHNLAAGPTPSDTHW